MTYSGIVEKGKGTGVYLGFPTINIPLQDPALSGSYVARVHLKGHTYPAAAYADQARNILEAHLLDFAEDLYGISVRIELLFPIREKEKFEDTESLKSAIHSDVEAVRAWFAQHP